ncbi:S8 family serine peptidase [Gottfriedia acidiceleris]|uniref:S8 family serine peptidase n=1 Tax=Gottfriedia acidiceleris TaxID=371036 RepID=A0ABY4JI76_9BACI|nr:S8 family serine peptidase [Gottfriedia acidiceleris]UPM53533.1 S8 family serine peptidase [Gottfriedia acidiceleris]
MGKYKIRKVLASATIGGVLLSTIVPYNVLAANNIQNTIQGTATSTSTSSLSNANHLTPEQATALNHFSTSSETKIDPNIAVNNSAPVRVIVEFKQAPAEIAVLQEKVAGNDISLKEAKQDVNDSHKLFKEFVEKMLPEKASVNTISTFGYTPSTEASSNSSNQSGVQITNEYKRVFNGVAMTLPGTLVEKLLESGLVNQIYKDEVVKVDQNGQEDTQQSALNQQNYPDTIEENSIPLPGIEDLHNEGINGKGIKVGVIDTGIDYNHPDLTDAYKGYRKVNNVDPASIDPKTVKGWDFVDNDADPMETTPDDWKKAGSPVVDGHEYVTYHGTHVSGTIAGQGKNNVRFPAKGVAPNVELYSYRVLGPYGSGSESAIVAGIEKSVTDGMNVVNLSLGAPINDPLAPESIAINNATIAGVTCVISAGNAGPGEGTLGAPGTAALAITVGASDFPMNIPTASATVGSEKFNNMKLLGRGFNDDLNSLVNKSYPVVYVGLGGVDDFKDANGQPINLTGKVALIQRGTYALADKVKNAKNAGAVAVLLYNNIDGEIDSYLAQETDFIPSFRLTKADGERLKTAASSASITFTSFGSMLTEGNHLAGFSSRGPVSDNYDIKPDIVAPGVSVYSSYPEYIHSPEPGIDYSTAYARISGTSMASPHVAGIAALILQAHPNYTPAEVKEALQNTADKLSDDYSVYEVGAGLVDVKEAVHSDVAIEVKNQTLNYDPGSAQNIQIDDKTGSLPYGTIYKKTSDTNEGVKTVTIKNKGSESKSFDISYEYSKAKTGVLDAASNNVEIKTSLQSVTVAGGASSDLTATIRIPTTATTGRYEGYVNIVNHDNPSETYRLPFAVHVVDRGIGNSTMATQAISQVSWIPANPFQGTPGLAYLKYRLNSPMKSVRIFIYDKDGKMLGVTDRREEVSNAGTKLLDRDIFAGFDTGDYYQYVGNPNDVITLPSTTPHGKLTEGQYYAQIRAVDLDGTTKYLSPLQLFVIDNTLPKLTIKDHAPGKVYELKDSDFTTETMGGNAFNAFWIHANLYDEGTSKLAPLGLTQSSNTLWYYFNQKFFPDGDFPIDNNGDTKFGIEKQDIEKGPATMILFPMDKAGNAHLLNEFYPYAFIKEGSPYVVPTYDKKRVSLNDTLTMTLDLNNVEKLMSGTYNANYYKDYLQFVDVKVNKKFQDYADTHGLKVTVDDPVIKPDPDYTNSKNIVKLGAHITGNEGFSGDIPFLDVTFKVVNDEFNILWDTLDGEKNTTTFSYTKQGETNETIIPSFNQINSYQIIPKHSYVTSYVRLPGVGSPFADNGISKFVTSAYAQGSDGKKYPGTVADDNFIDIHGIPLSKDPYDIVFEAPGYLKSIQKVQLGTKTSWGEDIGELKFVAGTQPTAVAGDVNGDGMIDVLDAKQVFDKMGQQDNVNYLIEDFNKDGIVDKKDMQSVASNIYKSNPDVTTKPKEVIKVDGKDMYATDFFNLAKVYSNVNTFKVSTKNANSATLNWLAVDPAGVWGGVKIQQQSSKDGITWPDDFTWTDAKLETPITVSSTSAKVTGLSDSTYYRFRLVVMGGLNGTLNGGKSNVIQMTTLLLTPTIDVIDDNDTTITGKANANVNIVVKNNNTVIGSGKTDASGNYSIQIKPQKADSVLTVSANNATGNESETASIVVLDRTAPDAPIINTVTKKDQKITGRTEANATVAIKFNNVVTEVKADQNGNFSLEIPHKSYGDYIGLVISVTAKDAAGNVSVATETVVLNK